MLTENSVIIPTNEYQTPITKELLDMYPAEVHEQFLEFVDTVPLIKYMIGTDRKRAKDLPKDSKGRIIVDITHPHILENMDYFRPAGLFYKENGCYTLLKVNSNPNSEYGKWLKEEFRRCRDGYVRESDGEWVTGYMYWFLNYNPIMLNRLDEDSGIYIRQEDFPDFWEGIYYRFHYLDQARHAGKHGMELARRGASKSFSLASIMSHNLILGENAVAKSRVTTILTASTKEYLSDKDGTFTKFTPMIDFVFAHTEFPKLFLKRSPSEMIWRMGYKNSNGNELGSLNAVMGLSTKDDEGKIRGKRGYILFEEMGNFPNFKEVWNNVRDSVKEGSHVFSLMFAVGCVCAGTKVWLPNGRNINIEELKQDDGIWGFNGSVPVIETISRLTTPREKPCVRITLEDKTTLECSVDHPIYVQRKFSYKDYLGNYTYADHATMHFRYEFIPAGALKTGDRVCEARKIPAFGNDHLFDARLVGMLIGDGTYGYDNTPKYSSEDKELLDYVETKYETGVGASHITKSGNLYKDIRVKGICAQLREIGIYGQVRTNKRLPVNYQTLTKEDTCLLLAGLYDTDGTVGIGNQSIELCQSNKEILEQVSLLLRKFGIYGHIVRYEPRLCAGRKDKNPYYRLGIRGRLNVKLFAENIPLICRHKREALLQVLEFFQNNPSKKPAQYDVEELKVSSVKAVEYIGNKLVYNMTVSGSHTYIANNIITHNTAGDDASDFSGVQTILYHPSSFEVYALENVYDRVGKGTKQFSYFFPSYISRAGCMDKDGNSDVVKALLEILMERWTVKQSGDAASLLSRTAQMPITPAEAILKVKSNFFPVTMLTERLRQIDQDPHFYDDVYVGTLIEVNGHVEFRATDDVPLRQWKVDNSNQGALEIYEMPPAVIPLGRYIVGCLTEGQMVTTDSGLKAVETVTLSDKLLNKEGEFVSIKNLQRRYKQDEPVYSIKLVDVYDRVELTGNHPVYAATPKKCYHGWKYHLKTGKPAVYYKYDFGFKRADELRVGDVVKSPTPYFDERPIPFDKWEPLHRKGVHAIQNPLASEKFWWIVGLVLGDGWCRKSVVCVAFNSKERQYISRFKDAVASVFHKKVLLVKDKGTCVEYQFCCLQFSIFFTKWFGKYASGKHISDWVKYLPKSCRLALLTGYLDSDGCCTQNSMEFVSVSKKLLCDVQDILLSLGIISGLKKLRDSRTFRFGTSWANYESECKPTYSLAVARAGVEKFSELLGGMDLKLRRFNHRPTANHAIKRCWFSDDGRYVYYKITDISVRNYTGVVYNFECDTHTYMCNRLPVHNCDPVDNDQAESSSFSSNIVFDLFTDKIVAEFTGRLPFADDNFEMLRLLGLFYKATIMVEANKKGYYSYFAKKHCTWMLADCPEYLRDRQLVKYSMFGSAQKGITVNGAIITFANGLIKDWLLKTYTAEFKDENGAVTVQSVPNVYRLRNRALIEELIGYAPEVNTDRVSALAQVMLCREQYLILYGGSPEAEGVDNQTPAEDDFFDRDWKRKQDRVANRRLL